MSAAIYEIPLKTIAGEETSLAAYAGKVLLVVNVASFCGFTPQYSELQQLHEKYGPKGLVVLGVPSNDFGAQEPKSEAEIKEFCETSFGVTFPMTAKANVVGVDAHGLYEWISGHAGDAVAPKWNFHKFLFDKDGHLAHSWPSKVSPTSKEITGEIEMMLAS